MHFWLQFPVTTAPLDADINKSTAIDVYQWFREVCSTTLLNTPIVLGGNGVIVEIDESLVKTWGNSCPLALAASPWASPSPSVMGIWNGGHFPGPRSQALDTWRLFHHGMQHSFTHNSSTHSTRNNNTLRPVARLQHGQLTPRCTYDHAPFI